MAIPDTLQAWRDYVADEPTEPPRLTPTELAALSPTEKETLRKHLTWEGYGMLCPGVYAHPGGSPEDFEPVHPEHEEVGVAELAPDLRGAILHLWTAGEGLEIGAVDGDRVGLGAHEPLRLVGPGAGHLHEGSLGLHPQLHPQGAAEVGGVGLAL